MKKGTVSLSIEHIILIILGVFALAIFVYYFFILGNNVGSVDYTQQPGISDVLNIA